MIDAYDVALVGAGPIGIEMAVALKQARVRYVHLEAKQIGFTISWFAPQTRFFSSNERIAIAGVPLQTPDGGKSTREQYLTYLRCVVEQFDLQINTYEPVTEIRQTGNGFELSTRSGRGNSRYLCKSLILATGGTDHPRKLDVPGESLPHVEAYFTDPHKYFRKRLLIVGGKNSAVEAALRCYNAGADVAISYRQAALPDRSIKYWLLPEINTLLGAGKIKGYFNTAVTEIAPGSVRLRHTATGDERQIAADFVLSLIGYEQDDALFKLAGLKIRGDCNAPVLDPETLESSVPGVHIIGTAVGGTQDKYNVFIENCHVHVPRALAAITKTSLPAELPLATPVGAPES